MMVLITYDVATADSRGSKRLRAVAKLCERHGQRVQNSVFECLLEPAQWISLQKALEKTIDPTCDSLRYYHLGSNWKRRVEHVGAKVTYDPEGILLV
ncbi:MAG: CRISPR-associated endonuclease Cas2 [Clostridiales bacterium]|nr:CRISPR-associated endonuclease Cas2 [Clostridiales bacterium]